MAEHSYNLRAKWIGGLKGSGEIISQNWEVPLSAPSELGGLGKGTNPEELLLSASASCYLITLAALTAKNKLPIQELSAQSELTISTDTGFVIKRIEHAVTAKLSSEVTESERNQLRALFKLAEQYCMVSGAMKNNVVVHIDGKIENE